MTSKHTKRWADVLEAFIDSYNKSFHRTIGMAPNEVTLDNSQQVADRMYPLKTKTHWNFQVNDKVRISKYKNIFEKGYLQNWSDEIFVIALRHESNPPTYGLKDLLGEEIKGRFYEQELQKVIKKDTDEYTVEKVLKSRRRKGKLEHFVKWQGYADKFNSWTSDVHRL